MGFEIFLIVAGGALVALSVLYPKPPKERQDPKDAFYGHDLMYDVRGLLTGLMFLVLGLSIFMEKVFGLSGDWFLAMPILIGIIFASIGLLVLMSAKFNRVVWKFIPPGKDPRKDRRMLGGSLLIGGLILSMYWTALLWPY